MGKFFFVMMLLPIISMVIGGFLGYLRTSWSILLAVVLVLVGYGAGFDGFMKSIFYQDPWGQVQALLGFLLMCFGPWLAFFATVRSKRQPAPIDTVIEVSKEGVAMVKGKWDSLDDAQKERIVEGTKKAARFGVKRLGAHLRRKGFLTTAAAIIGAVHLF